MQQMHWRFRSVPCSDSRQCSLRTDSKQFKGAVRGAVQSIGSKRQSEGERNGRRGANRQGALFRHRNCHQSHGAEKLVLTVPSFLDLLVVLGRELLFQ